MFAEALSLIAAAGGVSLVVWMLLREPSLPSLARSAILCSAFGLFISSRYAALDHSVPDLIYTFAVAIGMFTVGFKHFKAFPPAL